MHPVVAQNIRMARRSFLGDLGAGVGAAALSALFVQDSLANDTKGSQDSAKNAAVAFPNFAAKAKRIIFLFQNGGPSQVDLFDDKPKLRSHRGEDLPASVHMGQRLTTMTSGQARKAVLPAIAGFRQSGENGVTISDFLPHTASIVDDLCIVKSLHTEAINHAPATTFFMTGSQQPGRPSIGAWLSYGLGAINDDLPTFCVLTSRDRENSCGQLLYDYYWGSGFLPSRHQGVKFRGEGDPVLYLSNPAGVSREIRRGLLDDLAGLNAIKQEAINDPEIATRISQYEMAFRMQASVPELIDLSTEPEHILEMYGPDVKRRGSYAYNCLLARRLAEQGVRFIQLMHAGWDQHKNLPTQLAIQCRDTDQPSAALVKDLKQRGLLDDTLVVWGGEFGRTVFCQGDIDNKKVHGRDHHPRCFTMWLAGGGAKSGLVHGETDDYSYNIVRDPVHVHDLQATILHCLGVDHRRLTFRFQGRYFRLTDVHGEVVTSLLA